MQNRTGIDLPDLLKPVSPEATRTQQELEDSFDAPIIALIAALWKEELDEAKKTILLLQRTRIEDGIKFAEMSKPTVESLESDIQALGKIATDLERSASTAGLGEKAELRARVESLRDKQTDLIDQQNKLRR